MDKMNGVISGNDCTVWLNGQELNDIESIEYTVTLEYEDVNFLGDPRTYKKYVGSNGAGTLNFNKTQSRGARLLANAIKTGMMPDVKIVTKLNNPATRRAERAVISGVTFNEFGASTEPKAVGKEALPFNFTDIDYVEFM